jgi:hypothetical protein
MEWGIRLQMASFQSSDLSESFLLRSTIELGFENTNFVSKEVGERMKQNKVKERKARITGKKKGTPFAEQKVPRETATIKKRKKNAFCRAKTLREKQEKGTRRRRKESKWTRASEVKEAEAYLGLGLRADVHELDAGGEGAGEGLAKQGIEEVEARLSCVHVLAPLLHDPDAGLIDAEAEQGVPHGDRRASKRIEEAAMAMAMATATATTQKMQRTVSGNETRT